MNGKNEFVLFPTPFPDEILYSVLCRFYQRSGSPAVYQMNQLLWDKRIGSNLIMPQMLDAITGRIPSNVGITSQRLVDDHTLYPYFKPFFSEERWLEVYKNLRNDVSGKITVLHSSGFIGLKAPRVQVLRYCEYCWREDIANFGEKYWHRVHQLPSVMFCPVHASPIYDSDIMIPDTTAGFYPASLQKTKTDHYRRYSDKATGILLSLSIDSKWVLENSNSLGFLERINKIYDLQLREKGFRGFTGQVFHHILYNSLYDFYGKEVLETLEANNTTLRPWTQRLIQSAKSLNHPVYHLLLMRFLAGSLENFFKIECKETLPFGEPPWPCRNYVCEYHLKNVIEHIDLRCEKGRYKAVFSCPYCGMVYRRKHPVPKEKQYADNIWISDRGWKWKECLREHFRIGSSMADMIRDLHCDYYTIKKYGVALGFLPLDQKLRQYQTTPKGITSEEQPMTVHEMEYLYRKRWLAAISTNPAISRQELCRLEHESYLWLRANDVTWYEENSPLVKKTYVDWAKRDDEYLRTAKQTITFIKSQPGRPVLVSLNLLKRYIGVPNLHFFMKTDKIPKTKAYLMEQLESRAEWRKRKVYWAVQEYYKLDKIPTLYEIIAKAAISKFMFLPIKGYARECVKQIFHINIE